MRQHLRLGVVAASISLLLFSCQKELVSDQPVLSSDATAKQLDKSNTFFGPQVRIGDGMVRSFIRISHTDVPEEIGLEMTPGALQNLPQAPSGHVGEYPINYEIPLHKKATEVTAYDHLEFGWQPNGHPPEHVFDVPHFDIHFYLLSVDEQMTIPEPGPSNINTLFGAPPAGVLPASYVIPAAPVAQMGRHWLAPPPPNPFEHVMIYGTYDGRLAFVEPMITRNYLLSNSTLHQPFAQPTVFNPSGTYYAGRYNVYQQNRNTIISLDQFVLR